MNTDSRFHGTFRYVYTHWPTYLVIYGGGLMLVLLLLWLAAEQEWWAFVPLALALLIVLGYFLFASLWSAHTQFDQREHQPAYQLFEMARLRPESNFVHVGLGRRDTAVRMSRRLLTGRLTVVDVYHPQLTPSAALARSRRRIDSIRVDPRLAWFDGNVDLLPLPDRSSPIVTMNRTLFQFWQHGDRLRLLKEIYRILEPGGHLVLVEPARTSTSLLVNGPGALRLPPLAYWLHLFQEAGFHLEKQQEVAGLVYFWTLQRPIPGQVQQLTFDFGL